MSKSRAARLIDLTFVLILLWTALAAVPASWMWFSPGAVIVSDSTTGKPPLIEFDRTIKRNVKMTYQVTIRRMTTKEPVCDPQRGPFTYHHDASLPLPVDLIWWSGADKRCWPRDPGTYLMETCWTVVRPFWGIVPPNPVCRTSNPFTISPAKE